MTHRLARVNSESDWRDYHAIRRAVLFEARGKTGYREDHEDEFKPGFTPLLLVFEDKNIGTVRVDDWQDTRGVIRLVAIRAELQRQGHGRELARLSEEFARQRGIRTLYVNAALESIGYYRKMGWEDYLWDPLEAEEHDTISQQMRKFL